MTRPRTPADYSTSSTWRGPSIAYRADRADIEFGVKEGVDFLGLRFVSGANDLRLAREVASWGPGFGSLSLGAEVGLPLAREASP